MRSQCLGSAVLGAGATVYERAVERTVVPINAAGVWHVHEGVHALAAHSADQRATPPASREVGGPRVVITRRGALPTRVPMSREAQGSTREVDETEEAGR